MKNKLNRDLPWKPQYCVIGPRLVRLHDMSDSVEKWSAVSATAAIFRVMRQG